MKSPPWLLVSVGEIGQGFVVTLDPVEGRHATGPLRLRGGDEVVLADGMGQTAAARLVVAGKLAVKAEVTSVHLAPPPGGTGSPWRWRSSIPKRWTGRFRRRLRSASAGCGRS